MFNALTRGYSTSSVGFPPSLSIFIMVRIDILEHSASSDCVRPILLRCLKEKSSCVILIAVVLGSFSGRKGVLSG